MKTLITLSLLFTLNANAQLSSFFGGKIAKSTRTSTRQYSVAQIRSIMNSNKIACLKISGKLSVLSNGFIQAHGNNKDLCTKARAEAGGYLYLSKKNLDNDALKKFNKIIKFGVIK